MSPFIYVLTTNGLLFLLSLIFWKFPPKNINRIYGYRTHKSMLNGTIWKFANSVFNKHFIIYSGISLIAGLVLANFSTSEMTWEPMILVILTIVVCIIKTERALSDTFTEEGKKK